MQEIAAPPEAFKTPEEDKRAQWKAEYHLAIEVLMFSLVHRTNLQKAEMRAAASCVLAEMVNLEKFNLRKNAKATLARLRFAMDGLITTLSLGKEPVVRPCPKCHQLGMQDARRCGYCWTDLEPAEVGNSPRDTFETDRIIGQDQEPSMYNDHIEYDVTVPHHQRPW